ncbi:MAG TPA: GTP cyclohydrolase II [Polyangiaceae bacterium]|nr:GTP cyclohydrolase II [Polyangiaceae bacterium]
MEITARAESFLTKSLRGELSVEAEAPLPTRHGTFRCIVFRHVQDLSKEHVAIVNGEVAGENTLLRVHSECMTSEVFGSLKCDCAEQLELSLARIGEKGRGVVLYLRQEGRSIGLANKIRAYALQAEGADTVDANRALNLPDDARRYDAASAMLFWLGVRSVRLMTNNPAKVEALRALGVSVRERVPVIVEAQPFSAHYLAAKRTRMRHVLP